MKKILLLLSTVVLFGSCKKEMTTVNTAQADEFPVESQLAAEQQRQVLSPFSVQKKAAEISTLNAALEYLTASTADDFTPMEQELLAEENPEKIIVAPPMTKITRSTESRVRLRDVIKMRKELKATANAPVRDGADILAILGLIFGIAGVGALFASATLVGVLLGIGGLAFGIIALQRVTGLKTLSSIGIILGVLVSVVALIILVV